LCSGETGSNFGISDEEMLRFFAVSEKSFQTNSISHGHTLPNSSQTTINNHLLTSVVDTPLNNNTFYAVATAH